MRGTVSERFWSKVKAGEPDECWPWTASKNNLGYGWFRIGSHDPSGRLASRVAWVLARGEIPNGLCVCHHCDNPSCCNPSHLFLGTPADNNADRDRKGRGAAGWLVRGASKLTEADVAEIRRLHSEGVPYAELGKRFGVHRTTVGSAVRRRTWAGVP